MKPQETRQPKALQQFTFFILLCLGTLLIAVGCQSGQTYPDLSQKPECSDPGQNPNTEDFRCGLLQDMYDDRFGRVLTNEEIDQMAEAMSGALQVMRDLDAQENALEESGESYAELQPPSELIGFDRVCEDIVGKGCVTLIFEPTPSQEAVDKIRDFLERESQPEPGSTFFN